MLTARWTAGKAPEVRPASPVCKAASAGFIYHLSDDGHRWHSSPMLAIAEAPARTRDAERTSSRNGTRARTWESRASTAELETPRCDSAAFPGFSEPHRTAEWALAEVVKKSYIKGPASSPTGDSSSNAVSLVATDSGGSHAGIGSSSAVRPLAISASRTLYN
jgi:hypothetical protein